MVLFHFILHSITSFLFKIIVNITLLLLGILQRMNSRKNDKFPYLSSWISIYNSLFIIELEHFLKNKRKKRYVFS